MNSEILIFAHYDVILLFMFDFITLRFELLKICVLYFSQTKCSVSIQNIVHMFLQKTTLFLMYSRRLNFLMLDVSNSNWLKLSSEINKICLDYVG